MSRGSASLREEDRHLAREGCDDAGDLGGLRTADDRTIRRGAVVRAAAPDLLTADGWASLWRHGIRTVVDVRNDDELTADAASGPAASPPSNAVGWPWRT